MKRVNAVLGGLLSTLFVADPASSNEDLIELQEYLDGIREQFVAIIGEDDPDKLDLYVSPIEVKVKTVTEKSAKGGIKTFIFNGEGAYAVSSSQEWTFTVSLSPLADSYMKSGELMPWLNDGTIFQIPQNYSVASSGGIPSFFDVLSGGDGGHVAVMHRPIATSAGDGVPTMPWNPVGQDALFVGDDVGWMEMAGTPSNNISGAVYGFATGINEEEFKKRMAAAFSSVATEVSEEKLDKVYADLISSPELFDTRAVLFEAEPFIVPGPAVK